MKIKTIPNVKILFGRFLTAALLVITLASLPVASFAQDPTGAATGTMKDLGIDTVAASHDSTLNKVVAAVNTIGAADGHNKIAINIMWTLIAGFLVMFMQAGFALVETGFTQKKNVAHTMGMNFLVYGLGMFGFWVCGFAFMFGGALNASTLGGAPGVISHEYVINMFGHDFGIAGTVGFFLNGIYGYNGYYSYRRHGRKMVV
jgi:ammonium transporter, Amt family